MTWAGTRILLGNRKDVKTKLDQVLPCTPLQVCSWMRAPTDVCVTATMLTPGTFHMDNSEDAAQSRACQATKQGRSARASNSHGRAAQ
jgi:hypothetical protein